MKTPEEWSKEIYDLCYSPISGRATVKPEFVKRIQDDALTEAVKRMEAVPVEELATLAARALEGSGCPSDDTIINAVRARLIQAAKGDA